MEDQLTVACGHVWCLWTKGSIYLSNGSEPVSFLHVLVGGGFSHHPFIKGFHWPNLGQAHITMTQKQVLKLRLPEFPGQSAAHRILDSGRWLSRSSLIHHLGKMESGGWLLCRKLTLKAKRDTHYCSKVSEWYWQENETQQSPLNMRAVQFAPRWGVNSTGLIQVSFVFVHFWFLPTNHSGLVLRLTSNNSAFSVLRLEPEGKTKFKLLTNSRSNF